MNQLALNQPLDHDLTCSELLSLAQRELSALFTAATDLFGAEQAELSAEDWLHEVEGSRTLPKSAREWRRITAKVIARLADRVVFAMPVHAQLQPAHY